MSYMFGEQSWPQIKEHLEKQSLLILPIGTTRSTVCTVRSTLMPGLQSCMVGTLLNLLSRRSPYFLWTRSVTDTPCR